MNYYMRDVQAETVKTLNTYENPLEDVLGLEVDDKEEEGWYLLSFEEQIKLANDWSDWLIFYTEENAPEWIIK